VLVESFDTSPNHGKAIHQAIDLSDRVLLGVLGQMGVANRGQNRLMPENLLDLNQIDSRFDQVRGIAMA
jgi:hypothetical protein